MHGDLLREDGCKFWLDAIPYGRVAGVVRGPPCETWSKARAHALERQSKGPKLSSSWLHDGLELLEHPAEPTELIHAMIWFAGVWKTRVYRGLFEAVSPKPTDFLTVNLPSLGRQLDEHQLYSVMPQATSIGTNSQGAFRTSRLKK